MLYVRITFYLNFEFETFSRLNFSVPPRLRLQIFKSNKTEFSKNAILDFLRPRFGKNCQDRDFFETLPDLLASDFEEGGGGKNP